MMKKMILMLVMSLILCACSNSSAQTYFYIASNQDNIAYLFKDNYPMPVWNYAFPFAKDVLEIAEMSDTIEAIYPYYPLKIYPNTETVSMACSD